MFVEYRVMPIVRVCKQKVLAICFASLLAIVTFDLTHVASLEAAMAASLLQDQDELVDELVNQLGSPSFDERQIAAEQLWQMGPGIKNRLQFHAQSNDLEVVKRIGGILDAYSLGIDSETSRSNAMMVIYFEEGERRVRNQILSSLRAREKFRLLYQLVESETSFAKQSKLFRENIDFDNLVNSLSMKGEWEHLEFLLTHPLSWQYEYQICGYWAQLNGTLDQYINDLKSDIDRRLPDFPLTGESERAQKKFSNTDKDIKPTEEETAKKEQRLVFDRDLQRLVRLLRASGRNDEALKYAQQIDKSSLRFQFVNRLLMEKGDWSAVLEKLYDRESDEPQPEPEEGRIPANKAQLALVCLFAGDEAKFQKYLAEIEAKTKPDEKEDAGKPDEAEIEKYKKLLADLHLFQLDWESAEKLVTVDDKTRQQVFSLLVYLQRPGDALKLYDLGDSTSQRLVWLQRQEQRINSLYKKYARTKSDKVNKKLTQVFDESLLIAQQLGALGFDDEATLHLRTFADLTQDEIRKSRTIREKVVAALVRLEQFDEVWKLIDDRFNNDDAMALVSEMFGNKSSTAEFFMKNLLESYPNHKERLERVAFIVNSPLQRESDIDNVDHYLSLVLDQKGQLNQADMFWHFAKVMRFHGRDTMFLQYLEQASQLSHRMASYDRGMQAYSKGDFETSARFYDLAWKKYTYPLAAVSAAKSFQEQGDLQGQRRRELIAYASWMSSYRTDSIVRSFQDSKLDSWMVGFLKFSVFATKSNTTTNEHYRVSLAMAQEDDDPISAAMNWRLHLFDKFGQNSRGTTLSWAALVRRYWLAEARARLKDGDVDGAMELGNRLIRFRPGDADLGKKLIAELDSQDMSTEADAMFSRMVGFYAETLGTYPDSPLFNNNYAWLCATSNRRLGHSEFHSDLALSRRRNNTSYIDTRAEIGFLNGDREKAIELAGECIRLDPTKKSYLDNFFRFGGE